MKKRGMSGVIETIILVLMVMAAIVLVWAFVNSIIGDKFDDISSQLDQVKLNVKDVEVTSSTTVRIQVERLAGDGEISGIKFILADEENSFSVDQDVSLNVLEMRIYNVTTDELDLCNLKEVGVAPIMTSESGKKIVGNVADETTEIVINCA